MTDTAAKGRGVRWPTLIGLATGLGLLGALAIVYIGGTAQTSARACTRAEGAVAALQPTARGEVAAFIVERRPIPLIDLAFRDGEDRERKLSDWRGRFVLLNLWATWCAPCRHEMPALDRLEATLGGPDFAVVAVSIDLRDDRLPRQFYQETGIRHLPFYQDRTARVFQDLRGIGRAVGMPTTVLIDREGCVLGHLAGPAEWASDDALALIRTAMRGG